MVSYADYTNYFWVRIDAPHDVVQYEPWQQHILFLLFSQTNIYESPKNF